MDIAVKKFKFVLAAIVSMLFMSALANAAALCESDEHARCADVVDEHIHEDAPVTPCLSCVTASVAIQLSTPVPASDGSGVESQAAIPVATVVLPLQPVRSMVRHTNLLTGYSVVQAVALRRTLVILV